MAREIEVTIGTLQLNQHLSAENDFYVLKDTPEIFSTLSTRQSDRDKQGGHGSEDSLSQYEARVMPFKGEIHASSQDARKTMEYQLQQAVSLSIAQDFDGDDGYRLVLITDEDGIAKQIYAKILDPVEFELIDIALPEARKFSFMLYAKDPELYSQTTQTGNGPESYLKTTLTVQDGLLPLFQDGTLPTVQDAIAASMNITNNGTFGSAPIITVTGPTTNPIVKNETTGRAMNFSGGSGITLKAGETLTIDVASQTIVYKDETGTESDISGLLTTDSNWIFIEPGSNVITLFDDTPDDLSGQLQLVWRDSWI